MKINYILTFILTFFTANMAFADCASAPTSSLVVNVIDKGAYGDGSTNDTAAIQAAIDQVGGTGGTVLVPDGTYMIDAVTYLKLKSNMTFSMTAGAVLKAIPNNMDGYRIISMDGGVSNVNIIGGTVQGERNQHQGTTGEFGMGVSINNSHNVVVEGVTAIDSWGDGFFIGYDSSNITFCSVVADNNRRQGMSIVEVDGIVVKDSTFKNTNGAWPMDGIDIEPDAGQTVNNVLILNSEFFGNYDGINTSGSEISNVVLTNIISHDNRGQNISIRPENAGQVTVN